MYKPYGDCQVVGLGQIYAGVFGYKTDGVFVEIGAYDGLTTSNTAFLADLGWTGLYAEPMPEMFEQCCINHRNQPKICVINCLVGDGSKIQIMHNHPQHLYTGSPVLAKAFHAIVDRGILTSIRLDELLPLYGIKPNFDILSIDVEGMEMDVLSAFSSDVWMPKLIIIEAHEFSDDCALNCNAKAINTWMTLNNYQRIYADHINNIYVRMP